MDSVSQFKRTLNNRFTEFKQCLGKVIESFSSSDETKTNKLSCASQLAEAGDALLDLLDQRDQPPWLSPITITARQFAQHGKANLGHKLLQAINGHSHKIVPIVIADDSSTYDFDKLYEQLRDEGQLPELFDKMIKAVTQMLESGEIDSVTVVTSLQKLLDILKTNRNGSYVAVTTSFQYARYIRNLALGFLKKIPTIDVFVDAYDKTVQQTEDELKKFDDRLQDESLHMIVDKAMIARLEQLSEKQPLLLDVSLTEEALREDSLTDENK